ncbi:hypothetical protein ACLX1H_004125 [Fusarium chlamydosporum]
MQTAQKPAVNAIPNKTDKPQGDAKGGATSKGKGKATGKEKEPTFQVGTVDGGKATVKAAELRKFYRELHASGRVARVLIEDLCKDNHKRKAEQPLPARGS